MFRSERPLCLLSAEGLDGATLAEGHRKLPGYLGVVFTMQITETTSLVIVDFP